MERSKGNTWEGASLMLHGSVRETNADGGGAHRPHVLAADYALAA